VLKCRLEVLFAEVLADEDHLALARLSLAPLAVRGALKDGMNALQRCSCMHVTDSVAGPPAQAWNRGTVQIRQVCLGSQPAMPDS
jgi:hypothetical protein